MAKSDSSGASTEDANASLGCAWFCLRSQPRHEHIAARHLSQMEAVQVFNPRIKFARRTKHGVIWMTESLFPNYLFARFDWKTSLNRVHYAPGVGGIVHFGDKWPTIPDSVIEDLKAGLGPDEVHLVQDIAPGDTVQIVGGNFHDLQALVTQLIPGRDRVVVLMHFLGRQTSVEVGLNSVVKCGLGR
ncbi:MAG TPA: transcription termination/antitermination NusG family protein [Candidatus Saccharimonadales bacterium]|nr:transcription termination/antitermination NusG family protein [Candidatus Saccharimonadales bacterium]